MTNSLCDCVSGMCKNFLNHSAIPPEYDLATYDYPLPEDRIAQFPAEPRDSSKLLIVRPGAPPEETIFRRITQYLRPGDLMVFNNTRVFPARLYGHKRTGARIEFLLLQNLGERTWQVMARPARRLHPDDIVDFEGHLCARIVSKNPDGSLVVEFNLGGEDFWRVLDRLVGYKVSPFLWKTITHNLSAGRVQSVALRLVCEREQEIVDFKAQEYWQIEAV